MDAAKMMNEKQPPEGKRARKKAARKTADEQPVSIANAPPETLLAVEPALLVDYISELRNDVKDLERTNKRFTVELQKTVETLRELRTEYSSAQQRWQSKDTTYKRLIGLLQSAGSSYRDEADLTKQLEETRRERAQILDAATKELAILQRLELTGEQKP
jgi:predicted RNase H-like nuclease (RuvC/YqgF family)